MPTVSQPPVGDAAIAAVAESHDPSPDLAAAALAVFMGDVPAPRSKTRFTVEVDFGEPEAPNFLPCTFRAIEQEQIVQSEKLATVRDAAGDIERLDPFAYRCAVFAYACVIPNLPQALAARIARGEKIKTTADVVALVFRWQPGVLQHIVLRIESLARFGDDGKSALREVAAGNG